MFTIYDRDILGPNARVLTRLPLTQDESSESFLGFRELNVNLRPDLTGTEVVVVFVDLETTGLEKTDEAIELGMVKVTVIDGQIKRVLGSLGMLNKPSKPLSEEITRITGITNAQLEGESFDVQAAKDFMEGAQLVIAHNAGFDRPFFDRTLFQTSIPWACSSKGGEVDWKALGYKSAGLENIALEQGFFYDAHRAVIDCLATVWVLHWEPEACQILWSNALKPSAEVRAWGSPFSAKDILKKRGYFWNADLKVWCKNMPTAEEAQKEIDLLEVEVYRGAQRAAHIVVTDPVEKYKETL